MFLSRPNLLDIGLGIWTYLEKIIEHIIDILDCGITVNSTSLDLSKAFDCLEHSLILDKFILHRIERVAHNCFSSYWSRWVQMRETIDGTTTMVRSKPLKNNERCSPRLCLGTSALCPLYGRLSQPRQLVQYAHHVCWRDYLADKQQRSRKIGGEQNNFIAVNLAQDYCVKYDLVFNEDRTIQLIIWRRNAHLKS